MGVYKKMNNDLAISKQRIEQERSNVIESQRNVPRITKMGIFAHGGRPQQERVQRMENKKYLEQLRRQEEDYNKQLREINQNVEDFRERDRRIIERNLIVQQREDRRKKFPDDGIKEKPLLQIPEVNSFVPTFSLIPQRRIVRGIKRHRWL